MSRCAELAKRESGWRTARRAAEARASLWMCESLRRRTAVCGTSDVWLPGPGEWRRVRVYWGSGVDARSDVLCPRDVDARFEAMQMWGSGEARTPRCDLEVPLGVGARQGQRTPVCAEVGCSQCVSVGVVHGGACRCYVPWGVLWTVLEGAGTRCLPGMCTTCAAGVDKCG